MGRTAVAAMIGLFALTQVHAEAQAGAVLSSGEVRALFPGTFEAVWKDKSHLRLGADGKGALSGTMGVVTDSGRWWIRGNELCISFRLWTQSTSRCGKVIKDGGWYLGLLRKDGTPRLRFRRI